MTLRIGFLLVLGLLYAAGMKLAAMQAPGWIIAALMGAVFIALVAAMYLRVLPALLALPVLAIALASIAGMHWQTIFTTVVQDGSVRLSKWIIAAIMGSVLAQVVEKTGIAQTAVKKTAELGGDKPMVLAVLLTIVIALLFTTLGGLGAVIMVATIVIPILLSLGLRPLYVGCLFLLAMSLGGAFNLVNWQAYQDTLGMKQDQIIGFALPFAGLMLIVTFIFLAIEGKRMGKARYKAEIQDTPAHPFVPWYALLTPLIPLIPVLAFALLPKLDPTPLIKVDNPHNPQVRGIRLIQKESGVLTDQLMRVGDRLRLKAGSYEVEPFALSMPLQKAKPLVVELKPQTVTTISVIPDKSAGVPPLVKADTQDPYEFPIVVALLLGILYGAITTWRSGVSTVQLLTKSAFDGVSAVGPALVLLIGIGMVLNATMSAEVSGVISPVLARIVPHASSGTPAMLQYIVLFTILSPLALYRGPMNLYGMGAGLIGALKGLMPAGALMAAFTATGMIQGVCDPTNTHNVWIANYTNTDVQDILKRTLPYMWALSVLGLILGAVLYYGGVIK